MTPMQPTPASERPVAMPSWGLRSEKIQPEHCERLAAVYIRQSTPQQVLNHQESTRLQYGLRDRAIHLGWAEDRVLVIDDDLGKSGATAEGRVGFQRLVSEVGLGHVGIIFGVEMSRLARSCKDWHQLLEVCALFGTLIADLDGIYDPAHYNDRLLLGLKGTMSEAELHILKQRMSQGRLNKARRGELAFCVPAGYVRRPSGEVVLDPDEQVQGVIRLIFRKFEDLGTLGAVLRYLATNRIQVGLRARAGLGKGEIEWRQPSRMMLQDILHNPIYAGAYAYGRRQVDPRRKKPGRPRTGSRVVSQDQWIVLIQNHLPAYISWEQFEGNGERLRGNQSRATEAGAVRGGSALLAGLVICGRCGHRMAVQYSGQRNHPTYFCARLRQEYGGEFCQSISGRALDPFVSTWALKALAPAALELSLEAAKNLQQERDGLCRLWEQRLERARYEAERTARQYRLVDPENRLVARQIEREWEEKLAQQKKLEEEQRRFEASRPRVLSEEEREAIRRLAADIPALWGAGTTTDADRKEILRQLIERVVVDAQGQSENVRVIVHWVGGGKTEGQMIRPVAKVEHLTYYPNLRERIRALASEGLNAKWVAERLNAEGFRPPKRRETFDGSGIRVLMRRFGLYQQASRRTDRRGLGDHEWWATDLAREISMPEVTLNSWVRRGAVKARKEIQGKHRWIVWADDAEVQRLRERHTEATAPKSRAEVWRRQETRPQGASL